MALNLLNFLYSALLPEATQPCVLTFVRYLISSVVF